MNNFDKSKLWFKRGFVWAAYAVALGLLIGLIGMGCRFSQISEEYKNKELNTVVLVAPDGRLVEAPADQLRKDGIPPGFRQETPDEYASRLRKEKAGAVQNEEQKQKYSDAAFIFLVCYPAFFAFLGVALPWTLATWFLFLTSIEQLFDAARGGKPP